MTKHQVNELILSAFLCDSRTKRREAERSEYGDSASKAKRKENGRTGFVGCDSDDEEDARADDAADGNPVALRNTRTGSKLLLDPFFDP